MIDLKTETWAAGPTDSKAHLYFDDGRHDVRRLCHRARVDRSDLREPQASEKCRLCLNIRGLIVTRRSGLRHRKKVGEHK